MVLLNKEIDMKKKDLIFCICPAVALILEALPWGAVLFFSNPEGDAWRRSFSYFSLTPFGYANFAPFITALLTCAILALSVIFVIGQRKNIYTVAMMLSTVAFIVSLMPLLYGIRYFSLIGAGISALLLCNAILLFAKRGIKSNSNCQLTN